MGALVRDGQCVRLIAAEGSMIAGTLDILWPRGSTAKVTLSGEIEVIAQDGEALGVTGTRVQVTGGAASAESRSSCTGPDRSQIEVETIEAVS
jgi:type IV pilus biogenesis protein CpaD/CtpE